MIANYWCKTCLKDLRVRVPEPDTMAYCPNCLQPAKYLGHSSLPAIHRAKFNPYECPVTSRPITSEAAHRQNLAQQGCRLLERGELEDSKKARQAAREAEDMQFAQTLDRAIDSLPPEKLELLAQSDATVNVIRG